MTKSHEVYVETSRQHPASDTAGHSVLETVLRFHSTHALTAFDKHSTCYLKSSGHFWEGIPWGLIWGLKSLRSLGRGLSVHQKVSSPEKATVPVTAPYGISGMINPEILQIQLDRLSHVGWKY